MTQTGFTEKEVSFLKGAGKAIGYFSIIAVVAFMVFIIFIKADDIGIFSAAYGLLVVLFLVLLYILPACVANRRHHHQAGAITVLNILLGWTILGWIISLVWASTETRKRAS